MIGDKFKPTLDVPLETIPWDKHGSWVSRLIRWLFYTRLWQLTEDWYFQLPDGTWVKIPKGFSRLDGVSSPKIFRFLVQPTGILFIPSVIHDYAYRYNKLIGVTVEKLEGGYLKVTGEYDYHPKAGKLWWDNLFRSVGCQVTGFRVLPAITYIALLAGGTFAWDERRREEKERELAEKKKSR